MPTITTFNCNGIRASLRKGLDQWIARRDPDILCLQEVRARPQDLGDWASRPAGRHACWHPAQRSGYSGVAIISRRRPDVVRRRFGDPIIDGEGRWLEADFGLLTVVSLYLPSGTSGDERQLIKYQVMAKVKRRMDRLLKGGRKVVIAGDFNIAHTERDIANWRGNLKNSGFLPDERAWLGALIDPGGWCDVFRKLDGRAGRYTWWSQRGSARQRNVGWRIDYQFATPAMARRAESVRIDKRPLLSDHAPLTVSYR